MRCSFIIKIKSIIRFSFPTLLKSMELPVLFSILLLYTTTSLLITTTFSFKDGNQTDRSALSAFKAGITKDPLGTLSSWNDSLHFCEWRGVTCGRKHSRVTILDLNTQMLAGSISPYIGNLTFLQKLDLRDNSFVGKIPQEVGRLFRLKHLILLNNSLEGEIPINVSQCFNLVRLVLFNNKLVGRIPVELGSLSKLTKLYLGSNILSGRIPSSLGNLSSLSNLFLRENNLGGTIPDDLGQLTSLEEIDLSYNHNKFNIGLTLPNLYFFSIANNNKFTGLIPASFSNCSGLQILQLSTNKFVGSVPDNFGKLKNLNMLSLSINNLGSGDDADDDLNLLTSLTKCSNLRVLNFNKNNFGGMLPSSIANFSTNLKELLLGSNKIYGSIPAGIQNLVGLTRLGMDLGNNSLSKQNNMLNETIPKQVISLSSLSIMLDLGNNSLSGSLPLEVGNLINLGIPLLHLPGCPNKVFKEHKKSHSFKVIILIIVGIILLMFVVSSTFVLYYIKKSKRKPSATSKFGDRSLEMVSYNEILKATDGFSSSNLLGVGSFGNVSKAIFHEDEKPVVVKVLKLQQRGSYKSFMAECDALRNVRHRNLLKIITSCSSIDFEGNDFKALIFEFMPNGSLENWLHQSNSDHDQLPWRNLSFKQRLSIAIDVASALDYLHNHCEIPIVHCDLKPSNVLLDDDWIAHVSDFGLAKFLHQSSTDSVQNQQNSSVAIKGSIGYIAPEYGMGSEVSTQGDVYSYGILLLEMFTGKRPTADMFKDGISLHTFSKMALLSDQIMEIVDACLLLERGGDDEAINTTLANVRDIEKEKMRECLISIIRIGVLCSAELPADRMDMRNVVVELQVVKDVFLALECTETSEIWHISRWDDGET